MRAHCLKTEHGRHRNQAELRQLVPPVERGEHGRREQDRDGARGEQESRLVAASAQGQPAQGQHEPGREHRAGQVDPPPVAGQEGGRPLLDRRIRVAELRDRGVGRLVGPDRRAEPQVGRRVPLRAGAADGGEAVQEVAADGFGVIERLVPQDPQAEVAHHRVPGHPGRRGEGPLRRLRVPGVEVRVALRDRLRGAQRPFIGWQVESLAGGEVRDPPVEERAVERGEVPLTVRGGEPAQVADDRDQEAAGRGGQPGEQPSGRPHRDQQVQRGRDDHDQVLVTERHRRPEQQSGRGRLPRARPVPPPGQDDQRRHDQQGGPDIGQHVLLEHQLQRVEQDRQGGHRRQPGPGAGADQHRVHQTGRHQPGQVLRQREEPQRVQQDHRDDRDRVAALPQRVRAPVPAGEVVRVLQVPHAVGKDQRRMVGHQHHAPQGGREHHEPREDPVPAQYRLRLGARGRADHVLVSRVTFGKPHSVDITSRNLLAGPDPSSASGRLFASSRRAACRLSSVG